MNSAEAINKALPIFLQYGSLEDEDLLDVFIKKGFAPDVARKIIVFMPIAFGRIIMNELSVATSDEFDVCQIEGNSLYKQRRKLKDVEVYRESFKIALSLSASRDETFWAVAGRSAELNGVNHLKAQGSEPQNLVLTPMATMWEIDEEPQQNLVEKNKTKNIEPIQTKSWWEFWK